MPSGGSGRQSHLRRAAGGHFPRTAASDTRGDLAHGRMRLQHAAERLALLLGIVQRVVCVRAESRQPAGSAHMPAAMGSAFPEQSELIPPGMHNLP
jgi:hypothetical protein